MSRLLSDWFRETSVLFYLELKMGLSGITDLLSRCLLKNIKQAMQDRAGPGRAAGGSRVVAEPLPAVGRLTGSSLQQVLLRAVASICPQR